jgi:hypothetical protein
MAIARSDFIADLVQAISVCRGDMPVPREFIDEALDRIDKGQEPNVERHSNGMPTMNGVYLIAARLEASTKAKQ